MIQSSILTYINCEIYHFRFLDIKNSVCQELFVLGKFVANVVKKMTLIIMLKHQYLLYGSYLREIGKGGKTIWYKIKFHVKVISHLRVYYSMLAVKKIICFNHQCLQVLISLKFFGKMILQLAVNLSTLLIKSIVNSLSIHWLH